MDQTVGNPQPFVKWAGGKRQLLSEITKRMPKTYEGYYEPFVGGGALFFDLNPKNARINDINYALINTYLCIKNSPDDVIEELEELDAGMEEDPKGYFYRKRDEYNKMLRDKINDARSAAMLIYINKHCFNGLYRVNSQGLFNVPFNGSRANSFLASNIISISQRLQSAEIMCEDFEKACEDAKAGDFVFFDSPYAPLNPTSFESYTKEGFSREDHERLAGVFAKLSERGCYCMLTNHDTELIRELYKDYSIDVVKARRSINSNASNRVGTEVIIRNYA